jgi:hypothetical protein
MPEVQKIACVNNAAFVMNFQAVTQGGKSDLTDNYPIDQTRVIDLADTPFREGVEFWPEVHAILGKSQSAGEHVVFRMNGQTATYEVNGTTFQYSINLLG